MMYASLILFFASLLAIVAMICRKLVLVKNGRIVIEEEARFEVPYLREIRYLTLANLRKYEHAALVALLRLYVRSVNLLKERYAEAKIKIKHRLEKKGAGGGIAERQEASKFLKMISDYKRKITEIKHKIKEEEKNS